MAPLSPSPATPTDGPIRLQAPRPLFIYGMLCAKPLLAWAMTGSAENGVQVAPFLKPARVTGYKRVAMHDCDFPAVVEDAGSIVEGFLLRLQTASQRRTLDDFEGGAYKAVAVAVHLARTDAKEDETTEDAVDADMYLWDGDVDKLSTEPWDLDEFMATRLDDWVDLYNGAELVGRAL